MPDLRAIEEQVKAATGAERVVAELMHHDTELGVAAFWPDGMCHAVRLEKALVDVRASYLAGRRILREIDDDAIRLIIAGLNDWRAARLKNV